jgi:uncharacterized membrane protein (DUF485 family)
MLGKILNTKLAGVMSFVVFIVYWFILSSVYFGFPPVFPNSVPSSYVLWFAIGLIVFEWSEYSFYIIGAKGKIWPLTKWGVTW